MTWVKGRLRGAIFGFLFVSATACRDPDRDLIECARAFSEAAHGGDVKVLLAFFDAATVADLERRAEAASDQVGGRRVVSPHEMVDLVAVDPTFEVATVMVLERTPDAARVRLIGADARTHDLELVREEDTWKVRIGRVAP